LGQSKEIVLDRAVVSVGPDIVDNKSKNKDSLATVYEIAKNREAA